MSKWSGIGKVSDLQVLCDTSSNPLPGTIVPCLMCAKPFLMRRYSGIPDQICPECYVTYADAAKIVCKKCKTTIARVAPEVMDSGFYVRPRAVLHADACNVCKPGLLSSVVLEVDEWERRVGRKTIVEVRFVQKPDKKVNDRS